MTAEFAVAHIPDEYHGTAAGYQHRKCRCVECRAWNAQRSRNARCKNRARQPAEQGEERLYVAYDETAPKDRPHSRTDDWKNTAACRGKPGEWWFPATMQDATVTAPLAAAICNEECPVRWTCGDQADRHGEPGIWGGVYRYLPGERRETIAAIAEAVGRSQPIRPTSREYEHGT